MHAHPRRVHTQQTPIIRHVHGEQGDLVGKASANFS